MKKAYLGFAVALTVLVSTSCSSAPKRAMQVNTIYKNVSTTLETANYAMISGNYSQAENLLNSAYKSAMSIDNYDLLTTVCLSYVSLYLSYQTPDTDNAQIYMDEAYLCASYSNNQDRNNALCDLSDVRLQLSLNNTDYNAYISKLEKAKNSIKSDLYNEGLFNSVEGDVYTHQQDYKKAEALYVNAVNIFTKECYLGEIGITWYKIAQVRSLGGNKKGALEAIQNAIKYDRDSENSIALGTDYYAMGLILNKGTPTETEAAQAKYCFEHSAQIFYAIGMNSHAEKSLLEIQ